MEDRVKEIIAEQLGVDSEQVTENASFTDDLGASFYGDPASDGY